MTDGVLPSEHGSDSAVIGLAIEGWRFARVFTRAISRLDAAEANRYVGQVRYFLKRIEETLAQGGFKLVNLEGHPYEPGMAVSAPNVGDFGPADVLVVDQMVEPIIMGPEGVRQLGTVILRKVAL
jgi:hypothetical protein